MSNIGTLLDQYTITILPLSQEDGGGFKAFFNEFGSGHKGYGTSPLNAVTTLYEVIEDLFAQDSPESFPAPQSVSASREPSGRMTLRIPKTLHAQLERLAQVQGVSVNQSMSIMLQSGATALNAGYEFGAISRSPTQRKASAVAERKAAKYKASH